MQRLFIHSAQVHENRVHIAPDDLVHLQVIKAKKGNSLILVLNDITQLWTVELTGIGKKHIEIKILTKANLNSPDIAQTTLIQCLPKQDKFCEILRCCTEIGVSSIVPALSERIVSLPEKKESSKRERWLSILKSAACQSQRSSLPYLGPIQTLSEIENTFDLALVFWEEEKSTSLQSILRPYFKQNIPSHTTQIGLVIGPEGGLSSTEVSMLREKGFISVSLGETILRVEHAGLSALSMVQYEQYP